MIRCIILFFILEISPLKAESLTLGYFVLGPHIYADEDGHASGPLPEFLAEYIAPAMGVEFNFVNMPLARMLKDMEEGRIAGAALFGFTEARNIAFSYPKNNFTLMHPVITVLNSHTLTKVESFDDLTDLSIGYVNGAIISPYMKKNGMVFTNIYGSNTWERNIRRLLKGHINAAYSPIEENIKFVAAKLKVLDKIRIIRLPEAPMKLYSLFSKHTQFINLNLAKRYDEAFERINGEKIYKKVFERYYGVHTGNDLSIKNNNLNIQELPKF